MEYICKKGCMRGEAVTRCRDCKRLGRESIVPGEYRCNRTERVTGMDDYCSKAVRRDAD